MVKQVAALFAGRAVEAPELLQENGIQHGLHLVQRQPALHLLLQRGRKRSAHGGVAVLDRAPLLEVGKVRDGRGVVAQHLLHALEAGALLAHGGPGADLYDVRHLLVAVQVGALRRRHHVPGEAAVEHAQTHVLAVPEQVAHELGVRRGQLHAGAGDLRVLASQTQQRGLALGAPEPVDELAQRIDHAHTQDAIELVERLEVLLPRRRRAQRRAHRHLHLRIACGELIAQEGNFGLGPHPTTPARTGTPANGARVCSSGVPEKSLSVRLLTSATCLCALSPSSNTKAAPELPARQWAPRSLQGARVAGSAPSCQSRMWITRSTSSLVPAAQRMRRATGPWDGISPINRNASAKPTWSRLGTTSYRPTGWTKSFCRHCVKSRAGTVIAKEP